MAFTVFEILSLIIAFLALIPALIILRQFLQTRLKDYFIVFSIFFSAFITFSFHVIASQTNLLISYQIHHIATNTIYFCIFLHAVRVRWQRVPVVIWYSGIIWFITLILLILFWDLMQQPDDAKVLFWNMPQAFISYSPNGAGLITNNDVIIYSTSFRIIADTYYSLHAFFLFNLSFRQF